MLQTCLSPANGLLAAVGDVVSNVVGVRSMRVPMTAAAVAVPSTRAVAAAAAASVAAVLHRVDNSLVVGGSVVLLRQQFPDRDEPGDGQGDEGSEQSLLGDQGDYDVSESTESGELNLQPDQQGEESLHQLLLLATS